MPQATEPAGFDRLKDPKHLASMFRRTGGVRVQLQGVETWGHKDVARELNPDVGSLGSRPDGGPRIAVTFPAGAPPDDVKAGNPITVDGTEYRILTHTPRRDGRLTAAVIGQWLHEVELYRPDEDGSANFGQQQTIFGDPLRRIPCEIRSRGGSVQDGEGAERAHTEWRIVVPPGSDVEVDDRLKLVEGAAAAHRFRVMHVGDLTDRWTVPLRAQESEEEF